MFHAMEFPHFLLHEHIMFATFFIHSCYVAHNKAYITTKDC